jgi:hypothetical protein
MMVCTLMRLSHQLYCTIRVSNTISTDSYGGTLHHTDDSIAVAVVVTTIHDVYTIYVHIAA